MVRRLEEAWSAYDHDTVRQLVSPNLIEHTHHTGGGKGIEFAIQANEGVRSAFPDASKTIEHLFAEGDRVLVHIRMRGTNQGGLPWFGIPANRAKVDTQWISIYRVEDDRVAEHWTQMDVAGMMQQLQAAGSGE